MVIILLCLLYGRLVYAPCDDAYIFYVYAKNFVQGNGLTFNGMHVQGYTSVSWVMLLSLIGLLQVPIHVLGEVLSTLSGGFALWAAYYLGRRLGFRRRLSLLAVLLLAATGDFAFYTSVGLEQVLFTGLLALAAALVFAQPADRTGRGYRLGIVLAALILTRPEGMLMTAGLLAVLAGSFRSPRRAVRSGLVAAVILAPVLIALRAYYGHWLPNTYYVKSNAGLANLGHGWQYMLNALPRYGPVLGLGLVAVVVRLVRSRPNNLTPPLLLFGLSAVWVAQAAVQGGDILVGGRMLLPALPLVYAGLLYFLPRIGRLYGLAGLVLLCAVMVLMYVTDPLVKKEAGLWHQAFPVRRAAGLYMHDNFEPGTTVALNAAGIMPYYSELPTIDMLGLNNEHIAHHGRRDFSLRVGHQAGDGEYVIAQKPDIILFGGSLNQMPQDYISDREIEDSPDFMYRYEYVEWPGIGFAFVRRSDQTVVTYPIRPDLDETFEGMYKVTSQYSSANPVSQEGPIQIRFKGDRYWVRGAKPNLPPAGSGTYKWTREEVAVKAKADNDTTLSDEGKQFVELLWLYDNYSHPAGLDKTLILKGPFVGSFADGVMVLQQLDQKNNRYRTIRLRQAPAAGGAGK